MEIVLHYQMAKVHGGKKMTFGTFLLDLHVMIE